MNDFVTLDETTQEERPMLYELFWQYIVEFYELLKYIFNDVLLGKNPW